MRGSTFIYDIAFELQEDLKCLSDSLGQKATAPLIRKIINALEVLEDHCQRYEIKSKEISKLQEAVKRLEAEKAAKEQDRITFEKDLEQIEEHWHKESLQLMKSLEKLQEENYFLKEQLEAANRKPRIHKPSKLNQQLEIKNVHLRLKETLDAQTEDIRNLKRDLAQRCVDFDAMQQQCINLSNINAEICERHCNNKLRSKRLIEEKSILEAQLLITTLNNTDDVFDNVSNNVVDKPIEMDFSWDEVKEYWQDRDRLKSEVIEKEERLLNCVPSSRQDDEKEVEGPINKEPLDKMSPAASPDSGIKRFFQKLLRSQTSD